VLYGHTAYGAVAASILSRIASVPNVTRLYGTLTPYLLGLSSHYPKSFLERLGGYLRQWEEVVAILMPASRYIITNDGTLGDTLFRHLKGNTDRLAFPRNGIDIDWEYWSSQPPDKSIFAELFAGEDPVVVSAGRLIEWKRFDRVVDIAKQLAVRGRLCRFLILGNGDGQRDLERRIEANGLGAEVKIVNNTPHDEMPKYLRAADIVLSMQDFTNLSNTVLEAIALERPVIALDVGGTQTVVNDGQNGLLVPLCGCVDSAADAIETLIDSEGLRRNLAAGCQTWKRRHAYGWGERSKVDVEAIRGILGFGNESP
jgi:glycosyltransferase involved in cell wall biosynthesis